MAKEKGPPDTVWTSHFQKFGYTQARYISLIEIRIEPVVKHSMRYLRHQPFNCVLTVTIIASTYLLK